MPPDAKKPRRVCFVTGTRAEFGLMESTLRALRDHPAIRLQLIATGMHTHVTRGHTVDEIRRGGWKVDAVIQWSQETKPSAIASATGRATAELAGAFARIKPDIVLVVGDRVEAFAAAAAATIGGQILAHVHGGDRAMGQADDALRHAISKLAHLHFPATRASGERLFAMGEDRRRIHIVGAPGVDGIREAATSPQGLRDLGLGHRPRGFVLFLLHPTEADDKAEAKRTAVALAGVRRAWDGPIVALLPNSDAGSAGIVAELIRQAAAGKVELYRHVGRDAFLGLLRDAAVLVGNSSAGIIEAGSFGTRVVDIGPRQRGRERGPNVADAQANVSAIASAIKAAIGGRKAARAGNPYDRGGAAGRICAVLREASLDDRLRRKLIRY